MVKFNITPERIAEACNVLEAENIRLGNRTITISVAHRFIVNDSDEYLVKVKHDADGDIESFAGVVKATESLQKVSSKRFEKLFDEFTEAAKAIVNPPSAGA